MRRVAGMLTVAAAASVLTLALSPAGVGKPGTVESASAGASPEGSVARVPRRAKVEVDRTRYGRILVDRKGLTLYVFTRDKRNRSRCYGRCANAWPVLKTRRKPRAGDGVRRRLLGTTRRRNGRKQVTYRGHPLYYYIGEDAPGEIFCQNVDQFGGIWYVISRSGRPVR